MPRYFFDLVGEPDEEGAELPDLNSAKIEAIRLMGEMLRESPEVFVAGRTCQVDVRDQGGRSLACIQTLIESVFGVSAPYLRQSEMRQA